MNKSNFSIKSMLFFSLLILLISSCSKDDAVGPDYVGTWSANITSSGIQIKDNMTFTKDGFTDLLQIYNTTTKKWINYTKTTGTISISGSTMSVTYKGIGFSTIDAISGYPTGTIVMYNEGSSEFESIFTTSGDSKTFNSQYSVSGNNMTIMTDNNGDGLYSGTNETTVYSKQ